MPEVKFVTRYTEWQRHSTLRLTEIFRNYTQRNLHYEIVMPYQSKFFLTAKINLTYQLIGQARYVFISFNAPRGWKLMSIEKCFEPNITPKIKMDGFYGYEFQNISEYEATKFFVEVTLQEDLPTPIELKADLFKHMISHLGEEDFHIKCNGETVAFNKVILQSVSDVFETMFKRDSNKEVTEDCMEIEDFSVETIKEFKSAILKGEASCPTVELMMFAHKYNVKPLVQYCERHIGEDVYSGNIFEVIKAAYFLDSDNLLNKAVEYLVKNARRLNDNEDWKVFKKAHPDCFIKMMDLIMFSK